MWVEEDFHQEDVVAAVSVDVVVETVAVAEGEVDVEEEEVLGVERLF